MHNMDFVHLEIKQFNHRNELIVVIFLNHVFYIKIILTHMDVKNNKILL